MTIYVRPHVAGPSEYALRAPQNGICTSREYTVIWYVRDREFGRIPKLFVSCFASSHKDALLKSRDTIFGLRRVECVKVTDVLNNRSACWDRVDIMSLTSREGML